MFWNLYWIETIRLENVALIQRIAKRGEVNGKLDLSCTVNFLAIHC
jgi:hypothetical protein